MTRAERSQRHMICTRDEAEAIELACVLSPSQLRSALQAEKSGAHRQNVIQTLAKRINEELP